MTLPISPASFALKKRMRVPFTIAAALLLLSACTTPTGKAPLLSKDDSAKLAALRGKPFDSLLLAANLLPEDTAKVNALNDIGWKYGNKNMDTAYRLLDQALGLAQKLRWEKGISVAEQNIGLICDVTGRYAEAHEHLFAALQIRERQKDTAAIASTIGNIGVVYLDQGELDKALDYFKRALAMCEKLKLDKPLARHLGNMGIVYTEKRDYAKALDCYSRALEINERIGNKNGASINLSNIGNACRGQADRSDDTAAKRVLYLKALDCYARALAISQELKTAKSIANQLGRMGAVYTRMGKFAEAETHLQRALALCDSLNMVDFTKTFENELSRLYDTTGRHQAALEHYKRYMAAHDTLLNEESTKKSLQSEMNFGFEKKRAVDQAKAEEAIAQQRLQRNAFIGGFVLVLMLAAVSFRAYRNKKRSGEIIARQKKEVEAQKHLVEEKQKEIIDSINYARRIQSAILPAKGELERHFRDVFVFYRPKDIVSGDFWWCAEKDGKLLLAAADCTGHGVPGGFMSVMSAAFLSEIISEKNAARPDEILSLLRLKVIGALKQAGEKNAAPEIRDGMDIVLCSFSLPGKRLDLACANNPAWIVRNRQLKEIAPDKFPVGVHNDELLPFTLRSEQMEEGDMLYLLSDGYPDQFGGPDGKKFKYRQLKELLCDVSPLSCKEQLRLISEKFDSWKGDNEQIDDVLVIGIRI